MKKLLLLFLFLLLFIPSNIFAIEINSPSAILIDANTGRILYEKNSNEKAFPASTTKILTAILVLENCNLNEEVTASYNAIMSVPVGGSNAAIKVDEKLTIKDLLKALLVCSANEAANILAEHVGGSIESFVNMMNTRAKELGANNTNFINANGLHDDNHYSTAYDLAIMAKYAMDNFPTFKEVVSIIRFRLPITDRYDKDDRFFLNSNQLIVPNSSAGSKNYYYQYTTGIKTGFTSQAGNCLVASATKDGVNLILVILGATQDEKGVSYRYTDAQSLFEYGFDRLIPNQVLDIGETLKTVKVKNSSNKENMLELVAEKSLQIVIDKTDVDTPIVPVISVDEDISAPISEGDILGSATYSIYDTDYKINLVAKNNVERKINIFIGFFKAIGTVLTVFLSLFILLFIIRVYNKSKARKRRITRAYNFYDRYR